MRTVWQVGACLLLPLFVGAGVCAEEQPKRARRAGRGYPPAMKNAQVEVYKTVGEVKLNMYLYYPDGHQPTDQRPAIVFFFGGGWRGGSPQQFEKQCEYFASRGIVAMAADYRVLSRQKVRANSCVADAKSAIRWVRSQADRLGVDPRRIVASGGSAGGHIAACTGVITGFDETSEDAEISSRPNAMVLFNPALVLAPVDGELPLRDPHKLRERMGVEPKKLSPYHHVAAGMPPTLILHGKADTTVPYKTVQWFTEAMEQAKNRCELAGFKGQPHGFFNYGRNGGKNFSQTVSRADEFLCSLGYLTGESTVDQFLKQQKQPR
jgi:acetyl esterase/lipase